MQEGTDFASSFSSTNGWFDIGDGEGDFIRNATINSAPLNANLGVYVLFEIVEANATAYVIEATAAENCTFAAGAELRAQMVDAAQ